MKIGGVTVDVLNDGYFRTDGGAMFGVVPKTMWERKLKPDDRNRVLMALRCLLLRVDGRTILVDTGIGNKHRLKEIEIFGIERQPGLLGELAAIGVGPDQVDIVVDTHLHFDHAGGNTRLEGDIAVPTFPRAEYWVQRGEWEDATHPNERTRSTYLPENLEPIRDSGRLRLFDGPTEIASGVRWVMTPGHTPCHTCVLIESGQESILFTVDVCPFAAHLERLAWVPGVDLEPLVAMETKRRVIADVLANDRLVIFDHDPHVVSARLTGSVARWTVAPVELVGD
ncbi:MAG TPA: MBL fold metallo-hydrolase [Chloroflexota bacterium]|nr:MBL fold metallo-hydrolase [Chloroflexota bacterium]